MATRAPCVTDEWYHCYNRGVDKRKVFESKADYERFTALLYVSNGDKTEAISDRYRRDLQSILAGDPAERGRPLVDIAAFSLMPTHVHLVLQQLQDGGIARFMQKVFTGYTMHFNARRERTGALFAGTYKAKHIDDDRYLKKVIPYVILNPAELFEPKWKQGKCDVRKVRAQLLEYPYSSVKEFFSKDATAQKITGAGIREYFDRMPNLTEMLRDAQDYYREYSPEV